MLIILLPVFVPVLVLALPLWLPGLVPGLPSVLPAVVLVGFVLWLLGTLVAGVTVVAAVVPTEEGKSKINVFMNYIIFNDLAPYKTPFLSKR